MTNQSIQSFAKNLFCICLLLLAATISPSIARAQQVTVVHAFQNSDGANPNGLILGHGGNFYGITPGGGVDCGLGSNGCGTLFQVTPSGGFTEVVDLGLVNFNHTTGVSSISAPTSFVDNGTNFVIIFFSCVFDPTAGVDESCEQGVGYDGSQQGSSFFEYANNATSSNLNSAGLTWNPPSTLIGTNTGVSNSQGNVPPYAWVGCCPPINPQLTAPNTYPGSPFSLAVGSDGNYYGAGTSGNGQIFRVTPSGAVTILYQFTGGADGRTPSSSLIQARDGNFYGTTTGSTTGALGTIFKVTPTGTLTTLHTFPSPPPHAGGSNPMSPLVQGADGSFYGTTRDGGAFNCGVIYEISPSGEFSIFVSFFKDESGNSPQGCLPSGPLILSSNTLFGTTQVGGADGFGTVYSASIVNPRATDGPIPPWAIVALGAGLVGIASGRLRRAT